MSNNDTSTEVLIIGGGIIGATCARELKNRGKKVLLVDAGEPGTGVTAACMGHIVVMDESRAQMDLTAYSQRLWVEILEKLPASAEVLTSGTLWVARDDDEMELVTVKQKKYAEAGIQANVIRGADLQGLEPNLRPGMTGGLQVPAEYVIYPSACIPWFLKGIEVRTHVKVTQLESGRAHLSDGTVIKARYIILACGNYSKELIPEIPITPRRGHLIITERYPDFCHHQTLEMGYQKRAHDTSKNSVAFNLQPRLTGQMLLGSSRDYSGYDTSVDHDIVREMIERAEVFMPGIRELKALRIWAGLRPTIPDGLPLIGPWPEYENVLIATGHEGLGITTSMGTAAIIADLIEDKPSQIDHKPFLPARVLEGAEAS